MIDPIVKAQGVDVSILRVTNATYDAWDTLDPATMTTATETVKAIVSQNVKGWEWVDSGRIQRPACVITVPSGTDLKAEREGRADRVTINGVLFEVREVRDQTHPFTKHKKLSASLIALPKR